MAVSVSDVKLKSAKAAEKPYRIPVGENVYLDVLPTGRKVWRLRYLKPKDKKPAIYTFGDYPDIPLKAINDLAKDVKRIIKQGIDPTAYREAQRVQTEVDHQAQLRAQASSFESVARAWHANRRDVLKKWSASNAERVINSLEKDVFPTLGALHMSEVTAPLLLEVIQKVIDRGALETAKKLNQRINSIFRYAVLRKLVAHNEADNLRDEIPTPERRHNPYLKSEQLGAFIRDVEADGCGELLKVAILLTLHCLTRTQETRFAQWSEFDLDANVWHIPAERMKMKRSHSIPLTPQVIALLERVKPFTSHKPYLFWNASIGKPFSENAMLQVLYRLGLKGKLTIHGLRATGSTVLNEAGFRADVIECALAHKEENAIRGAYNHAQYLEERRGMMAWWSDYLSALEAGAQVIPIKRNAV